MSDTAHRILDVTQMLIQTRGFSAISYNDIATALDIRKASIHYHFATKSDLGVAVVKRYASRLSAAMQEATDAGLDSWRLFDAYLVPMREFAESPDRICLCGALAGEFLALPAPMQKEVTHFFEANQQWLEHVIRSGRRAGAFSFSGPARRQARLAFSALQGALLVKRTNGDTKQIDDVIAGLKKCLNPA